MGKSGDADKLISPHRAARLYRLLTLVGERPQKRSVLLRKLRVDLRSFYRDIKFLRMLDIQFSSADSSYCLSQNLDDALGRLPFPDPGLSVRDVLHLVNGSTDAKKKLKRKAELILGTTLA